MLCQKIIEKIEKSYPREFALEWDNVGLLAGRNDKDVKRIYIALDATADVIDAAVEQKADMLITHHPLIFAAIRSVTNQDFIGSRLVALIQNDISYFAMHTNYDVLGMSELSGCMLQLQNTEVLDVTWEEERQEGIGRVAELKSPVTLQECVQNVKKSFDLGPVKVFGDLNHEIRRLAISPGAGKSMIDAALDKKADVLVTGDIDHHTGIDAVARNLCVIDAGHYGIEHIFIEDMKKYLEENLRGVDIITAPVRHPFIIV